MCILISSISSTTVVWSISHSKKNGARYDPNYLVSSCTVHVAILLRFHERPSSGSPGVPCGQTDMTKLIVAFRYFAIATKKRLLALLCLSVCLSVLAQGTSRLSLDGILWNLIWGKERKYLVSAPNVLQIFESNKIISTKLLWFLIHNLCVCSYGLQNR